MIGKIGKRLRAVLLTTLSAIMLITPISGALAATQLVQKSSPSYVELKGVEVENITKQALESEEVKSLLTEMNVNNLKIDSTRAFRWNYDNKQGDVLILGSKKPKDIQIVYTNANGIIKAGAGLFGSTDGNKTIDVFDIVDGKVYQTSTVELVGKDTKVNWKDGPLATNAKKNSGSDVTASSTSYTICTFVCGVIAYGGGCGLTGYFACVAACAPFGTATCPIICGVVYGIICSGAAWYNCDWMCQDLGFYP
ncbi:hypothetical protein [Desulfosporosinus meridiei]|uniref:hypothetical protein n=1 Tax=Desulfosporosinus meridiei TaxID=79209 RepID=UPI0002F05DBC|nr:hypothetical protein [Desulfosporosinus meridiei]